MAVMKMADARRDDAGDHISGRRAETRPKPGRPASRTSCRWRRAGVGAGRRVAREAYQLNAATTSTADEAMRDQPACAR